MLNRPFAHQYFYPSRLLTDQQAGVLNRILFVQDMSVPNAAGWGEGPCSTTYIFMVQATLARAPLERRAEVARCKKIKRAPNHRPTCARKGKRSISTYISVLLCARHHLSKKLQNVSLFVSVCLFSSLTTTYGHAKTSNNQQLQHQQQQSVVFRTSYASSNFDFVPNQNRHALRGALYLTAKVHVRKQSYKIGNLTGRATRSTTTANTTTTIDTTTTTTTTRARCSEQLSPPQFDPADKIRQVRGTKILRGTRCLSYSLLMEDRSRANY